MSHEKSFSVNFDGKEVLLPSVFDGKEDQERAIREYRSGKLKPIGIFNSPAEADAFAKKRSENYHPPKKGKDNPFKMFLKK